MSKTSWKFNADIKDNEWKKFHEDADSYVNAKMKRNELPAATVGYSGGDKDFRCVLSHGQTQVDITIDRDKEGGHYETNHYHFGNYATGILTIASKHFGDKISIETEDTMEQWQPGIDEIADHLKWEKGEIINLMTGKLGYKK